MHPSSALLKHELNSCFTFLNSPNNCMLATSPIIRRQQFLIRSLSGYNYQTHMEKTPESKSANGPTEADAENILRRITPVLDPSRHKGQAGKIAIFGGCREYTGAPYFAAISALKIGADVSHVFCTKDAGVVIKSYSPELIVHPLLEESYSVRDDEKASVANKVLGEVAKWMERFDCIVVGPGLGRDPFLLIQTGVDAAGNKYPYQLLCADKDTFKTRIDCVSDIMRLARQSNTPIVVDADGLFLVTSNLSLVSGYPLAVLTPNVNEYKRLVQKVLDSEVNDQDAPGQLLSLCKRIGGVTVLWKGKSDLISDGETVSMVSIYGSPRRCGGQGDILSGSVALFSAWAQQQVSNIAEESVESPKNPMVLGCIAGSALLRKAASVAFANKKRATLTTDIIEHLGKSLEDICPAT